MYRNSLNLTSTVKRVCTISLESSTLFEMCPTFNWILLKLIKSASLPNILPFLSLSHKSGTREYHCGTRKQPLSKPHPSRITYTFYCILDCRRHDINCVALYERSSSWLISISTTVIHFRPYRVGHILGHDLTESSICRVQRWGSKMLLNWMGSQQSRGCPYLIRAPLGLLCLIIFQSTSA